MDTEQTLAEQMADAISDLDPDRAKNLISLGANVNEVFEDGSTLLHLAISAEAETYGIESWEATRKEEKGPPRPDASILRLLLEAGADPNLCGLGTGSALKLATDYGHQVAVQLLVAHGASS